MKITLKARSSSGESYDVDFIFEDGSLSVHCTCKAAIMHTACKHRLAFLGGDQEMLADSSQSGSLATVIQWAEQAGFSDLLQQLKVAETEFTRAQFKLKKTKEQIEESMTRGLRRHS